MNIAGIVVTVSGRVLGQTLLTHMQCDKLLMHVKQANVFYYPHPDFREIFSQSREFERKLQNIVLPPT